MNVYRVTLYSGLLALLTLGLAAGSDEKPWMDPQNCDMCKSVLQEEGLMQNMHPEHHKIATGMVSVCTVSPDFADAYARAKSGMMETKKRMEAGEEVKLCQFCISMGSLMEAGATMENFTTEGGDVTVLTATDEALIAKIHEHTQKSIDFMAKMAEMGHEGHGH